MKQLFISLLVAVSVIAQTPIVHNQTDGTIYASPGGQSFDWPDGTKINGVEVKEATVNDAAAVDPTVNDDVDSSYSVGSLWFNTTAGSGWLCLDATDGAAVWVEITSDGDLLAANNLSDLASAATARANLGLVIGTDVQAFSAVLAATTASFLTADENKLDAIETAATADQTGAEIKTAYEGEPDTNAYDDAAVAKLAAIEASADVTDTANVTS